MSAGLGIDLGGTHMKAAIVQPSGEILFEKQVDTHASHGADSVIARMAALIKECEQEFPGAFHTVGVAVPGVLDPDGERVVLLPNFPDSWNGIALKHELMRLSGRNVKLMNDARAATFAELQAGAGRAYRDFLFIVIGTGVGGGIVQQGQLTFGSRGVAGELGHQVIQPNGVRCGCGNRGCLETIVSGPAIASAAIRVVRQGLPTYMRELVNGDINLITSRVVNDAAEQGDKYALEIMNEAAGALTQALRNGIALLNPEAVVIGGGVARSKLLLELIRQRLDQESILFPPSLGGMAVVQATHAEYAGAVGAALWPLPRNGVQN